MINQIVVHDGHDDKLGDFFYLCTDHAHSLCVACGKEINNQIIGSDDVTAGNIGDLLSKVNQQGFLFLGFVHGTPDSMVINGAERFVSTTSNYYLFTNSFIYTFSCYNGTELADILLMNGASVFWGYSKQVWVCHAYHDEFKKAALTGYCHFLNGDSASIAYDRMIDDMNVQIDAMYETDMIVASTLLENRDALVLKGNKELTISDLVL